MLCPEREWTGYEKWLQTQYTRKEWPQARELFVCAATITSVDRQGRITLPKCLVETLGMKGGNYLVVTGAGRWFFAYTGEVFRRLYESFYLGPAAKAEQGRVAPKSSNSLRKFPGNAT